MNQRSEDGGEGSATTQPLTPDLWALNCYFTTGD
jgi:hypothetical protein